MGRALRPLSCLLPFTLHQQTVWFAYLRPLSVPVWCGCQAESQQVCQGPWSEFQSWVKKVEGRRGNGKSRGLPRKMLSIETEGSQVT